MDKINSILENFNDITAEKTFEKEDIEKNAVFCIFAYLIPVLFFVPYVCNNNSAYCKFHANQSFVWLVTLVILAILSAIIGMIPIIGFIVLRICFPIILLAIDAAFIYGSVRGKAYKLPFVGELVKLF